MYQYQTKLRICYADTDQMGFVYYGNYAKFFEIGRVETIRSLGFNYKNIEEANVIMPVAELHVKYIKAAKYDDIITIETTLYDFPNQSKIEFHHKIKNEHNDLLARGNVVLYVLNKHNMKATTLPDFFLEKVVSYFSDKPN